MNKTLITGLVVILLIISEYVFSSYQYNTLVKAILKSENVVYSFYENYRPSPEIDGNIKTGIFFVYTKIDGTKVTNSFEITWDAWREDMAIISLEKKDELIVTQSEISQVYFLPWRTQKTLAKYNYIEHNKSWVNWLSALVDAKSVSDLDKVLDENFNINSTFTRATKNLEKAVPKVDLFGSKVKVNKIIQDDDNLETIQ
jgi:hypothetical protein